jgi:hypothetical protein
MRMLYLIEFVGMEILRGTEGTLLGDVIVNTEMPGLQCYGPLGSDTVCLVHI